MTKVTSTNPPMKSGGLLITGCPRSATRAVTAYFKDHGVTLGHEMAGEMGTVEWRHAYAKEPDFVIQLTLVRDPLKTVRSLTELLENCDRRSNTWQTILEFALIGGWNDKLSSLNYVGAASVWWTTVYERLYGYPLLKVEHLPKLEQVSETNEHRRVDRTFDVREALKRYEDFWRVARMYGYYLEDSDGD